jgi:hypothetical protein
MPASARFSKFVKHCGTLGHELRKPKGHWQIHDSGAAFRFEIPELSSLQVMQEFQIGGTRHGHKKASRRRLRLASQWRWGRA